MLIEVAIVLRHYDVDVFLFYPFAVFGISGVTLQFFYYEGAVDDVHDFDFTIFMGLVIMDLFDCEQLASFWIFGSVDFSKSACPNFIKNLQLLLMDLTCPKSRWSGIRQLRCRADVDLKVILALPGEKLAPWLFMHQIILFSLFIRFCHVDNKRTVLLNRFPLLPPDHKLCFELTAAFSFYSFSFSLCEEV